MNDLISRQAAIDEIKALYEWHDTVTEDRAVDHLKRLPSAEPEKRTEERTETHACDLIDREAAVDAIYHHLPSVSRMEVRLMLHEVPSAQPEPQWIPCSERLPEEDTHFYLTTIANHGLNFTTTLPDDVDVVRWDYDRRKGHNSWHWCTERTVIAWMPLPEPYEGGKDETD